MEGKTADGDSKSVYNKYTKLSGMRGFRNLCECQENTCK